ncbi:MAG: hypothetical protein QOF91_3761 [Alphaproteobacteria bacterium]|nr:hypothetical protein [Alphaproteobacteria bacterium]
MLATAAMLSGCALNGDFGRLRPELVSDGIHDWVGAEAVGSIGVPPSSYPLTDDERALRDLAFPLIEPPYNRNRWDSALREYGLAHKPPPEGAPVDRSAYWRKLVQGDRRSEASAYAQIVTDSRNDVERIEPFFAVAGRVIDMDRKRTASLALVSNLTAAEQGNAFARNNENGAIIAWVCRSLNARANAYRYALERLVIATPSAAAAEADRAHALLAMRITQYCRFGGAGVGARTVVAPAGGIVAKD